MADPTIEVDDGTSKDARMRTLEEGTSVNALLREHFEGYAIRSGSRLRCAQDRRNIQGVRKLIISWEASR